MTNKVAENLHEMADGLEKSADIARWQVNAYEKAIRLVEDYPNWLRYIELSRRAQSLSRETAVVLDTLAAEASRLAEQAESELG